ncbi:hypothetical protein VF02_37995 [Nostoc linckia z1]|nr:hypothetical protein VF02_37995 [Nostoc linckia z1]
MQQPFTSAATAAAISSPAPSANWWSRNARSLPVNGRSWKAIWRTGGAWPATCPPGIRTRRQGPLFDRKLLWKIAVLNGLGCHCTIRQPKPAPHPPGGRREAF